MALKNLVCILALQNTVALSLPVIPTIPRHASNGRHYSATENSRTPTSPYPPNNVQPALTDSHYIVPRAWDSWLKPQDWHVTWLSGGPDHVVPHRPEMTQAEHPQKHPGGNNVQNSTHMSPPESPKTKPDQTRNGLDGHPDGKNPQSVSPPEPPTTQPDPTSLPSGEILNARL